MSDTDIAARFASDTAKHELTVLHDEGLYRHLRFKQPDRGAFFWFDLITWPGCLTIRGDFGEGYTFARLTDMFEFFRGKGGINAHYWSEKLDSGRSSAKEYSEALFRQLVTEHVVEAIRYGRAPRGIGRAVQKDILGSFDLCDEAVARQALDEFEFKGFRFHDTWEWDFRDYRWQFLWACHAIVDGIRRYDAAKAAPVAVAGGAA
ncbi:hypothetical protein [Streptacidiphilus sp. EB129]|uniref:hypothetical protein n=1 Tax=Streptacidiphilus sp. EB129 TaxID=3156262 RepID=UPI0035157FD4